MNVMEEFGIQKNPAFSWICIRRNGTIHLDTKLMEQINPKGMEYVHLLPNPSQGTIGVRMVNSEDFFTFRLRKEKSRRVTISCPGLLELWGISYQEGPRKFLAYWSQKTQMLLLCVC